MRWSARCLTAVALLIAGLCTASARAHAYGPKARGYYGTPYGPGPQYGNGGGDQYGYGPGYSYARQAPNWYRGPY